MRKTGLFRATVLAVTCSLSLAVLAQSGQPRQIDIPPGDLVVALQALVRQSGAELAYREDRLAGLRTQGVRGMLTAEQALEKLLEGSGYTARRDPSGALMLLKRDATPAPRTSGARARPAPSTAAAVEPEIRDLAQVTVTGTRIRGSGPIGSPVIALDREALDSSGRATLAEFVQSIPQNFSGGPTEINVGHVNRGNALSNSAYGTGINLRGLGSGSTLTLFDGARPALAGGSGAFTDLSMVPWTAIERLEVLTDGASAVYGSDAVAGVVNVHFRNQFVGAETRVRGGTADGDYGELQLGQLYGTQWASGHLAIAGEYYRRGSLPSADRPFATEDLRPFGGPDLRYNYASPGTIVAANGQRFPIPPGQDGAGLSPADLVPGGFNRDDARRHVDLLPRQETASLYTSLEQDLGSRVSLFARALHAQREFQARRRVLGPSPLTVTPANPYYVDPIGTGQPITVYYDPTADFGAEGVQGKVRATNATFGVRTAFGSWSYELSAGYGVQHEMYQAQNLVHRLRLARALAATDPARAFNVFGDGPVNAPTLVDSLRGGLESRTAFKVWNAALRADGTLFTLPVGEVKAAVGTEYRRDRLTFAQTVDVVSDAPMTSGIPGLPDKRVVHALYGEVVVPVFDAGDRFPGALTVSAAARYEDYSDVGDTTNPRFGLRWAPGAGLALRASHGKSFRAPFFSELVGSANALYQTLRLNDPQSPTGQTVVLGLFGYRPDLGPEKAETWTAGFDFEPAAIAGARLSATYFDIRYRDRIANPNTGLQAMLGRRDLYGPLFDESPDAGVIASYFADPNFSNAIGVAPGDVQAILDARTRNLSSARVQGLDFDVGYQRPLGAGDLSLSLGGTRLFEIDNRITPTAPYNNVAGTLGNPVKLRWRSHAGYTLGAFDAGISVHHTDSYRNLAVTPAERVKPWTTVDLQLGVRIEAFADRPLRLALSVNNLFDKDPPYVHYPTIGSALAYDPEQANPVGRTVAVHGVLSW